jgi:hypothetical protein
VTTALAPTPGRAIRGLTSDVRNVQAALQRAWDIYCSQQARSAAEYHERVRRATAGLSLQEPVPASDQSAAGSQVAE